MDVKTTDSPPAIKARPGRSILKRLMIALAIVCGLILGALVLTAGGIVWWMRARNLAAHEWVEKEVARVQAAGEPITTDDCYAFQAARMPSPDITDYWIVAIDALDDKQLFEDGKLLPVVGNGPEEALRPDAPDSQFSAVQDLLQKHNAVLNAVFIASVQPGQCSLPVKFEDGVNAKLDHVQALRSIARLLKLQLRLRAYQGDNDGAIESLGALVATSEALNHEPVLVQYLVSLAVAGVAEAEAAFLLNELSLDDEQLARMQALISRLDPKGGLTIALYGERAMGYHSFHHLGSLVDDKKSSLHKYDGQLIRPVDCQTYLQWSRDLIECSTEDFPVALDQAQQFDLRVKALMKRPIERFWHITTLLLFPATPSIFEACAKSIARKETTIAAIAAVRFRAKSGNYPASLADLVPEFLTAIPTDPFSGSDLLAQSQGNDFVIYSVGTDRKDDKGSHGTKIDEPDIIVRLRAEE